MSLYYLNVTLHVLAAMVWLGGMFFFAIAAAPVLRRVEPPALRAELFTKLGRAFRYVGWVAIAVLLITGVGNLHFRGVTNLTVLADARFWATPFGHSLGWKLIAVAVMIVVSAIHDFVQGPRAAQAEPGSPEALRLRRRAAWLARINALIGVVVVVVSVRLARGG